MKCYRVLILSSCILSLAACELPLADDDTPKGAGDEAKSIEQAVEPVAMEKASDATLWLRNLPLDLTGTFEPGELTQNWEEAFTAEDASGLFDLPGVDLSEVESALNEFDRARSGKGAGQGKSGAATTGGGCSSGQKTVQLGTKCRELLVKMCACPSPTTSASAAASCQMASQGIICAEPGANVMTDEKMCTDVLTSYGSQLCAALVGAPARPRARPSSFLKAFPRRATTPPPPSSYSGDGEQIRYAAGSPPPTGGTAGSIVTTSTGTTAVGPTGGKTGTTKPEPEVCPKVTDRSDPAAGTVDLTVAGGCSQTEGKEKTSIEGEATLKGKIGDNEVDLTLTITQPFEVKSPYLAYRSDGSAHIRANRAPDGTNLLLEGEIQLWAQVEGLSERLPLQVGTLKMEKKGGETLMKGTISFAFLDANESREARYGPPGWRAAVGGISFDDVRIREDGTETATYDGGITLAVAYKGGEPTEPQEDEPPPGRIEVRLKNVVRGKACNQEPLSGLMELRGKETLSIEFDGATACDGRSPVTFKGETQALCVVEQCKPTIGEAISGLSNTSMSTKTASGADNELLQTLSAASAEELKADANGNGKPDYEDLLKYLEARVVLAPNDRTAGGQALTSTELLLKKLGSITPDALDRARFLQAVYDLAQFLGPMSDLSLLLGTGSQTPASYDMNTLIGPMIAIISPETPCVDKGLAQCGKDLADSIAAMGVNINAPGGYRLPATKVKVGSQTYDLGGLYTEAAFRFLAALGRGVHAGLYFAAAHVDINSLLSEATSLLGGGMSFDTDTAGQILTTLDQMDGLMLKIVEGAVKNTGAKEKLETSRDSAKAALEWLHGNAGSKPAIVAALENSTAADALLRFRDVDGDNRLGACDEILVRFFGDTFGSLAAAGTGSTAAEGCTAPSSPQAVQLPKSEGGTNIDYNATWPAQAALLTKLGKAVGDPSVGVTGRELAAGSPAFAAVLGDAFQVYPAVLFQSGLSALTPASTGSGSSLKLKIEAEISADAAACPDGKTKDGALICKNKRGDKDQSALISRGDAAHFAGTMAKDNLFIDEALLNAVAAAADSPYRASLGGGALLYLQFKDPTLKGLVKVSDRLIGELTDSGKAVCSRSIGGAPSAGYVATDDRVLNAVWNWLTIQVDVCGKKGLFGNFLDFDQTSPLFAMAP